MNEIANEFKFKNAGMAQCWSSLLGPKSMVSHEGLRCLQAEKPAQRNRNTRLISAARFRYQVTIEELNFDAART